MKYLLIFSIAIITLFCNHPSRQSNTITELSQGEIDSLKWLFYAYAFTSDALFKSDTNRKVFKPVECEISVKSVEKDTTDSFTVKFDLQHEGYQYLHLIRGLNIGGFVYEHQLPKPITTPIILDSMDNEGFLRRYNAEKDSLFTSYLRTRDTTKLALWLKNEARKRKIF
jgi:hypothetical protein